MSNRVSRRGALKQLAPGDRLGTYEVLTAIGAGAAGEVYRAYDTSLNREVALRVLSDPAAANTARLRRFEREAHTLASLNHPNIPTIHGVARADTAPALVLELVEGLTLQDSLAPGALPVDTAIRYAREIASALEAAHGEGIVHRRLRPANIKVAYDGTLKLLDFGLAMLISGSRRTRPPKSSPDADAGLTIASAYYISPEQARGLQPTRRSDVWAFGAIVYEMLTGNRPFAGPSIAAILAAVANGTPDWRALPRSTPPAVQQLLRRALERDPNARLRAIGIARRAIDDLAADGPAGQARDAANTSGRVQNS